MTKELKKEIEEKVNKLLIKYDSLYEFKEIRKDNGTYQVVLTATNKSDCIFYLIIDLSLQYIKAFKIELGEKSPDIIQEHDLNICLDLFKWYYNE